jgi:hypothetical protein
MTLAIERRVAVRYEAVNTQTGVELQDWAGREITRSHLVNISATGAMILADKVPELYRPLWLRIATAPAMGWIAAEPVRFDDFGEVGIRFYRPCPRDLLQAATIRERDTSVAAGAEARSFADG